MGYVNPLEVYRLVPTPNFINSEPNLVRPGAAAWIASYLSPFRRTSGARLVVSVTASATFPPGPRRLDVIKIPVHPGKLTWNLKMNPWKRRFLLETIIFRFHVSFRGGTVDGNQKSGGSTHQLRETLGRWNLPFFYQGFIHHPKTVVGLGIRLSGWRCWRCWLDIELLMIVRVLVVTKQLGWGTTQSKQLPCFFWQDICRNECSWMPKCVEVWSTQDYSRSYLTKKHLEGGQILGVFLLVDWCCSHSWIMVTRCFRN